MNKHSHTNTHAHDKNAKTTADLLKVTADLTGEGRSRVAAALESTRQLAANVRSKAVAGAKAADKIAHEHPYKSLAFTVGVGALLGFILGRRHSQNKLVNQD